MLMRVDDLCFFHGDAAVINGISCRFDNGMLYAVVGPNGSGKTTFLDLVSGYLRPVRGTVSIHEKQLDFFSKKALARQIALVSQDYTINLPYRVKDVVMMGRHPYISRFASPDVSDFERVDEAMAQCGIEHLKMRKVTELSGGEKQRCVFARALCQNTPILLLDEAFSGMDIRHTLTLLTLLKKQLVLKENKTVICVLHDLNVAAAWADAILFLKQGAIHAFGDVEMVVYTGKYF